VDNPYAPPASALTPPPPVDMPEWARRRCRVVAAVLAGGGAWGVLTAIWQRSSRSGLQVNIQLPVAFMLPFGACIAAGILLWRAGRTGVVFAMVMLALQVIAFRYDDFEYMFTAGLGGFAGFRGLGVFLDGRLGSTFLAAASPSQAPGYIVMNIVAVLCLVLLIPPLRRRWTDELGNPKEEPLF
jgi:hypothetical protein